MRPRVHVITLAVSDLERALRFFRDLGMVSPGVIGTEFDGDEINPAGAAAMFEMEASCSPRTPAANSPRTRTFHSGRQSPENSASDTVWPTGPRLTLYSRKPKRQERR